MKYSKLLFIPILLVVGMTGVFAQTSAIFNETTFYDNFNRYAASGLSIGNSWEENPLLGWQSLNANAANCFDDAFDDCASAAAPSPTSFLTRNISTQGLQTAQLSYMERCDSLLGEYFTVEGQNNTGQFQVLRNITVSCTGTKSIQNLTLPSNMLDLTSFKVRYTCSARGALRTCNVDNVNLSGERFCETFQNTSLSPFTYNRDANFCTGTYSGITINTNKTNGVYQCIKGNISFCYQEKANESQVSDGNCSLNYTGNYLITNISGDGYLYINYSKPFNVDGVIWQVRHGLLPTYNITIPDDCFSQPKLNLRLNSRAGLAPIDQHSKPECYNGVSWIGIGTSIDGSVLISNYVSASGSNMFDSDYTTCAFYGYGGSSVWNHLISPYFYGDAMICEEGVYWKFGKDTTFISSQMNINKDNTTLFNCRFESGSNITSNSNQNLLLQNRFNLNSRLFVTAGTSSNSIIINNIFLNSISPIIQLSSTSFSNVIINNTFFNSFISSLGSTSFGSIINNVFSFSPVSEISLNAGSSNLISGNRFLNSGSTSDNIFLGGIHFFTIITDNKYTNGVTICTTFGFGGSNFISFNLSDSPPSRIIDGCASNNKLSIFDKQNNFLNYSNTNIGLNSISNVFLGNNIVAINSTAEPNLNKTAYVRLVNLTQFTSQPVIFVVPQFTNLSGVVSAGNTTCSPPQCSNLSWNNVTKVLDFVVGSWSSMTAVNASAPSNINVKMKDEDTDALILTDGTLIDTIPISSTTYTTNTGSFGLPTLSFELHKFDVSAINYFGRSYFFTINATSQNFTTYLVKNSLAQIVKFNIRDESGLPVENADVIITKFIGSAFVTVQHENTGIIGFVNTFLNPLTNYRFMITAAGFSPRVFDLEPTETEYTIIIRRTATINFGNFLDQIFFNIDPQQGALAEDESQDFRFTVIAPNASLEYFTVVSNFSGTLYLNNVTTSPAGGTANISINTTGKSGQTVSVNYILKRVGFPDLMNQRVNYLILTTVVPTNTSLVSIAAKYKPEFGNTWSSIIAIFGSVILGITFLPFVGSIGAGLIAIFGLIFFSFIGWISFGITIASAVIVFGIYMMTGGRE